MSGDSVVFNEWKSEFPFDLPEGVDWTSHGIRRGQGDEPLEVVWGTGGSGSVENLRTVWDDRKQSRVVPVIAVHYTDDHAKVIGPSTDNRGHEVVDDISQLALALERALSLPDRLTSKLFIHKYLHAGVQTALGLNNNGLFSTHSLHLEPEKCPDWAQLVTHGNSCIGIRKQELMASLGFDVQPSEGHHSILKVGGKGAAIALFLQQHEDPDFWFTARFGSETPLLHVLRKAERENVAWVVITHGHSIRVYPVSTSVGVSRRGRTGTYCEILLDLLSGDNLGYLPLIFSADSLKPGGSLIEIIEQSAEHVAELGERLRDRIYGDVIPQLATGIAIARGLDKPTPSDLSDTHEMALTLLFRLLFIAYAEDRRLLPYVENEMYTIVALKTFALQNSEEENPEFIEAESDIWNNISGIVKAIHDGRDDWGIPAYGGTPFSDDEETSSTGFRLSKITLTDDIFGPVLCNLLIDRGRGDEVGPIDFRDLSVREFGTIYEGLLESELAVAEENLTQDIEGYYRPASECDEVVVEAGNFYLHNSGKRKSTASYFTQPFAVEQLLKLSLEPALDEHFIRVDDIEDDEEASKALFDFRVADISMGSGSFLISAIDIIESRFDNYLIDRALKDKPLDKVLDDIADLRRHAAEATGKDADSMGLGRNLLLRRQIARRCVYGVDINPRAVELAIISVWIHTFVPGIPFSFLDWRLKCGNSIFGVATQQEALEIIEAAEMRVEEDEGKTIQLSLFNDPTGDQIGEVAEIQRQMSEIGLSSDYSLEEVNETKKKWLEIRNRLKPWENLMDVVCASRLDQSLSNSLDRVIRNWKDNSNSVADSLEYESARKILIDTPPFHFQIAFPAVLWRDNPGFDVIVGNPPWNEATVEIDQFLMRFIPGFKAMSKNDRERLKSQFEDDRPELFEQLETERRVAQQIREGLVGDAFPGMGTGDPDLYKAFAWRFWNLLRDGGRLGIVVPRSLFTSKGSAPWRKTSLGQSECTIINCKNKNEWLFTEVNPGYSISLVSLRRGVSQSARIDVRGTFESESEFHSGLAGQTNYIEFQQLERIDPDDLCLPALDGAAETDLFLKVASEPKIGDNRIDIDVRAIAELHATNDKSLFVDGEHPVNNHLNVGRLRFDEEPGSYAMCDYKAVERHVQNKRASTFLRKSSAFRDCDPPWANDSRTHPINHPRIVIRDVVHASNPKKVWAALFPSRIPLTNIAPYLYFHRGSIEAQAYLLGMLNSSVIDWFGHTRINLHLNFYIFNSIPIPHFDEANPLHIRLAELAGALSIREEGDYGAWKERFSTAEEVPGIEDGLLEIDAIATILFDMDDEECGVVFSGTNTMRPELDLVLASRAQTLALNAPIE